MDLVTPRNVAFSAFYKRSFAYYTMKERIPVILTQTIDNLVRNKEEIISQYGDQASEELKWVIGEISKLKYEIQTNKPFREIESHAKDVKVYNEYLAKLATEEGMPTYFNTIWLYAECYVYRRIHEAFENTNTLKDFDPFRKQKQQAYFESLGPIGHMSKMVKYLVSDKNTSNNTKEEFFNLIKLNLWGNKQDLSISLGTVDHQEGDPFDKLQQLESYIICNQTEEIWSAVSDPEAKSQVVDIVLDNAGYELFTDLCIADYLISKNLATKVRLYPKEIPWFISDTVEYDIKWQIEEMKKSDDKTISSVGQRWEKYFKDGTWTLEIHDFWTLPFDFSYMRCSYNKLYEKLGEAKLVIFKGDLNYRKLFGEKNWDSTTPVEEALQGFWPAKLCILRTVKCDIICGIRPRLVEKLEVKNRKWSYHGDYGLIQFSGKVEQ